MVHLLKFGASTAAIVAGLIATGAAAQTAGQQNTPTQPVGTAEPGQDEASSAEADAAAIQGSDSAADSEEIVVTGTSLRGVAPVGSNLVSVSREAIEDTGAQTLQQILKTVPQITAAGNAGQGPAGTSYYSPTIHSLGSSASNSTLVLIDGHRFSLGGQPHPLSDPNIIPPIAVERVEVLAEGASSIYGSDAVAGVINFITRRRADGFEVSGQLGFGDEYRTRNFGALWGTSWDTGSILLAYAYSYRSALFGRDRDFFNPDHRPDGGTSFLSFNCSPATIQPGGAGNIYLSPTSATSVPNTTDNAPCDNRYADILPQEVRNNFMARVEQEIAPNIKAGVDFVYSNRQNESRSARGTLTATAFRTGAQANPFYTNPPGVTGGTTAGDRQTVRWSADDLLGPGAYNNNSSINYYVAGNLEWRIDSNWRVTGLALLGRETHNTESNGQLCGSCASLALNGTTNTGGSLTQPSIPGTSIIVTTLPLTAANALDVWNPAGSNRTSAAVLARLTDSLSVANYYHSITQGRLGIDGTLFELPGGGVRAAFGIEYLKYGLEIRRSRPNNTGPASSGSEQFIFNNGRNVRSAYGELFVPIIGEGNEMPWLRRLEITLSGRHDDYNDVGSTTNPKIGANIEFVRGFRLRGNWSRSFVAPAISSLGDPSQNGLASFSGYGPLTGAVIIPIANYPLAAQLPGCTTPGQVTCTIANSVVTGISYNNGNRDLEPQKGSGWSIGVDFAPVAVPGLRASATLFNAKFRGGVTSPNLATVINTPGLNNLLTIYPSCATAAQISAVVGQAPLNAPLPSCVYFIRDGRQQNVVNLDIQGIDANVDYQLRTEGSGNFTFGAAVSYFTKFRQNIGGGPSFSVLNSTGFNETFPSIRTQARFNVGWEYSGFSADLFANWIASYYNWSTTTVTPLTRDANGNPNGGGDPVSGSVLFDLNLSYTLQGGFLRGSRVFVDVVNLLDRDPPFYNSANGYDNYGANPIGRVITAGLRLRF
jgi:iron complex outermembrane receptor protein